MSLHRVAHLALSLTLALVLTLVAAVGVMALKPSFLLNNRTLWLAAKALAYEGAPVSWDTGLLTVATETLWRKRLDLHFTGLSLAAAGWHGSFRQADVRLTLSVERFSVLVIAFSGCDLTGGRASLEASAIKQAQGSHLPSWMRFTVDGRAADRWRVIFDSIAIARAEGQPLTGDLALTAEKFGPGQWSVAAAVRDLQGVPLGDVQAKAAVHFWPEPRERLETLTANVSFRVKRKLVKAVVALGKGLNQAVSARIDIDLAAFGGIRRVGAALQVGPQVVSGEFTVDAPNVMEAGIPMVLSPCTLSGRGDVWHAQDLTLKAACTAVVRLDHLRQRPGGANFVPSSLTITTEVQAAVAAIAAGRLVTYTAHAVLPNTDMGLWRAHGTVDTFGTYGGKRTSPVVTGDVTASVGDFSALVAALRETKWPVPAPLNQLHGPFACAVKGTMSLQTGISLPFGCDLNLSSADQTIHGGVAGQARLAPKPEYSDLALEVKLDDVRLVLPKIDLRKPLPRLRPDPRISASIAPVTAAKVPIRYRVHVFTSHPGALRVVTNLVEHAVPLTVSLVFASDQPLSGTVSIEAFDLTLFRLPAKINRMALVVAEPQPATINGRVELETPDYKIIVLLLGPAAHPRVVVESDPPMPNADALALAFFGKPTASLDEDQQRSTGAALAAMTSGALTLTSMYYLATTPIESVSYDPLSQSVLVKVRLASDLSLAVGAGSQTSTLGLRRNLGHNWWIETTAVAAEDASGKKGVAMLHWGKRY